MSPAASRRVSPGLLTVLVCLALCQTDVADAYNYLFYAPLFAKSHTKFLATIADIAMGGGHNITFLAPIVFEPLRNDLEDVFNSTTVIIKPEVPEKLAKLMGELVGDYTNLWLEPYNIFRYSKSIKLHLKIFAHVCEGIFSDEALIRRLQDQKFDVIVAEAFHECPFVIRDLVSIPTLVIADSFSAFDTVPAMLGEPVLPSYVPGYFSIGSDKMGFFGRMYNMMETWWGLEVMKDVEVGPLAKAVLGKRVRTAREMIPEAAFVLSNSNPFLDFPRPFIHKTIHIGGVTVDVQKFRSEILTEEWNEVLNKRPKNVLISFGSMVRSMDLPDNYRTPLLNALKSMPNVTFIWKYESDDVAWASGADNIHFVSWFPQTALLADKRVDAFITHGGLGSTNELAYLGKPAITVPIFADQFRNAHMLERHGSSIMLDKYSLRYESTVTKAIHDIVYDEKYAISARRLADILENQPTSLREVTLKHLEFAAKFGELKSLDPHGRQLNFFQYHLIDVFCFLLFALLLALFAAGKLCLLLVDTLRSQLHKAKQD